MQKIDPLNQVAEFHRTFKHPVLEQPTIPAPKRCALRVSLIAEELDELQEAIQNKDIVEIMSRKVGYDLPVISSIDSHPAKAIISHNKSF